MRQVDVAEASGIKHQSVISRIERAAVSNWEFRTILRIAEALDARVQILFQPIEDAIAQYGRLDDWERDAPHIQLRTVEQRQNVAPSLDDQLAQLQQEKLKEAEAEGYIDAAHRRLGAAQREAAEEQRTKDFMYSRALAVSTFSVAATGDPGMIALFGDINAEGEYRILSRLYAGEDEAEGLLYRAELARREGDAAVSGSYVSGITSALSVSLAMGGFGKFSQAEQMRRGIAASKREKAKLKGGATTLVRLPGYAPQGALA